jgi:8-oxo-dGTP diphosphatase
VSVYLVRHAKAGEREEWRGDDRLRPLSGPGRRQAQGLVQALKKAKIERVLSSPYTRCLDTVRPLAEARRLKLETTDQLAEGAGAESVLRLVKKLAGHDVVLCTHGDVMQETVEHLARSGIIPPSRRDDMAKGATWVLEERGGTISGADYLPAP